MPLPFQCDFIKQFVFGDLIYGTTFDRQEYIVAALEKLDNPDALVTIDRFTKPFDAHLRDEGFAKMLSPSEFRALPEDALMFLKFAQDCGPLWAKMRGEGVDDYTKKYKVAKAMPPLYGHGKKWSHAYMRAKCKVGIKFVLSLGFTVHFALDSLWTAGKMETIARKETDQPWHTGSELRWVYRHKSESEVAQRVLFYVDGKMQLAPWEQWAEIWKEKFGKTRMEEKYVPDDFRKL